MLCLSASSDSVIEVKPRVFVCWGLKEVEIAVAKLTVDSSRERGDIMSVGSTLCRRRDLIILGGGQGLGRGWLVQ